MDRQKAIEQFRSIRDAARRHLGFTVQSFTDACRPYAEFSIECGTAPEVAWVDAAILVMNEEFSVMFAA